MSGYRVLIYGFGNPGRQDDGVGVVLTNLLEKEGFDHVDIDYNYQLNIEDALTISEYDAVIFVDASLDAEPPFDFYRISAKDDITFTTHSLSPESVLALCSDVYHKIPEAYVLAVRGYEWEFVEKMSQKGEENLFAAFGFIKKMLSNLTPSLLNNEASIRSKTSKTTAV